METVRLNTHNPNLFKLVFDDRCPVVRRLGWIVKLWDRQHTFDFVGRDRSGGGYQDLLTELDNSRWSLLLVDSFNQRWSGPEAIPIILKNLPFGKLAAVLYILPGTMWVTRQLYLLVSRNRRRFA